MRRLPLDFTAIYSAWQHLAAGGLYSRESPYAARVSAPGWSEKLFLMGSVISSRPDVLPCLRCGECCLDFPFACRAVEFLYLLPFMAKEWSPRQQRAFFEDRLGLLGPDGRIICPFMEAGGCSVYPVRPLLCRSSVCGEHICNRRQQYFENMGQWCGNEAVVGQMTVMNLLYYDYNASPPVEMGWPVPVNTFRGPGEPEEMAVSVAPFEVWVLILFGREVNWSDFYGAAGCRSVLRFVKF